MRAIGEANMANFLSPNVMEQPGHLLLYPYQFSGGEVIPNPEFFADTYAKVKGASKLLLPSEITA
jgi:hypothetical protein